MTNDITTIIESSGNKMKSTDVYDTFMELSGPSSQGNVWPHEVHILMRSNDGEHAQGWFRVEDVLQGIINAMKG